MKKLFLIYFTTLTVHCNAQDAPKTVTLSHSSIDTAFVFDRKDYALYSYLPNNFPLHSGSEFWIEPKNLKDKYEFQSTNSMAIKSGTGIKVCVIPNKENFQINVLKNDVVVETLDLKAINFDKPVISVYGGGKLIAEDKIAKSIDSISVQIEQPNAKYRRVYPKDCRYVYDSLLITVYRGNEVIRSTTAQHSIALKELNLSATDKLIIEAIGVKRKNFINQSFKIDGIIKREYFIE